MNSSHRASGLTIEPALLVVGACLIGSTVLLDGPSVFARLGILLQVLVAATTAIRLAHLRTTARYQEPSGQSRHTGSDALTTAVGGVGGAPGHVPHKR